MFFFFFFYRQELSSFVWDQSKQQFLGPQQMAEREKRKNPDKQQAPSASVRENFFSVVCVVMTGVQLFHECALDMRW